MRMVGEQDGKNSSRRFGEFSHKIEADFCWVWEGFYGFGLWEVEMLWVRVMGVTLVLAEHIQYIKCSW